jgi:hypothetical protein
MSTQEAVKTLTKALREDPEFYYGYQSNIAMAFYDEAKKQLKSESRKRLQNISNQAAKNFLDVWIKE